MIRFETTRDAQRVEVVVSRGGTLATLLVDGREVDRRSIYGIYRPKVTLSGGGVEVEVDGGGFRRHAHLITGGDRLEIPKR